tara:strand:+ start:295 stop:582 length:288 start_codon:yes stop_codon:yes gene_type:complete
MMAHNFQQAAQSAAPRALPLPAPAQENASAQSIRRIMSLSSPVLDNSLRVMNIEKDKWFRFRYLAVLGMVLLAAFIYYEAIHHGPLHFVKNRSVC